MRSAVHLMAIGGRAPKDLRGKTTVLFQYCVVYNRLLLKSEVKSEVK